MANELIKLKRGLYKSLPTAYSAGTIYVTTDEKAMYVDISDTQRIRLGQIVEIATTAEWEALKPPYSTEAFYYVADANALLKYNGTAWVQLNSQDLANEAINKLYRKNQNDESDTKPYTAENPGPGTVYARLKGLETTVEGIVSVGGEANKIEGVKTTDGKVVFEIDGTDKHAIVGNLAKIDKITVGDTELTLDEHGTIELGALAGVDSIKVGDDVLKPTNGVIALGKLAKLDKVTDDELDADVSGAISTATDTATKALNKVNDASETFTLGTAESKISTLEGKVSTAESDIGGLKEIVGTGITDAEGKTETLTAAVTRIDSEIDNIGTRVGGIEERLENVTNVMDFRGAVTDLPTVEGYQNGDVIVVTAGDYAGKEYVLSNGAWVEFGSTTATDAALTNLTTRIAALEEDTGVGLGSNYNDEDTLAERIDSLEDSQTEQNTVIANHTEALTWGTF